MLGAFDLITYLSRPHTT